MSFQMYNNTSDNRYINKSLTSLGAALPCSFKDNTTMENPTIILSPGSYNPNCNYGFLSDTGRYYYVVDVTYSQQRIEVQLKVDVLKSFATQIRGCRAIANRSASLYNTYLNDPDMPAYQYDDTYTTPFSRGFDKNLNYVLIIGG